MRRTIIVILVIAVLAIGGYFGFRRIQQARANAQTNYQTVTMERGDLTASVGATGTVHANQSTVLAWGLSAKVADVKVAIGDMVKSGQELSTLDESSLPQAVILARADLVTAQRNLDQLQNSGVARAKAYQTMVMAQKELDDAKTNRQSKDYARASANTVDEARANLTVTENAVKQAEDNYGLFDHLPQDDPARANSFTMLAKARQNRDRALANLNYLLGKPDNEEIAQADARVEVATANLDDATREWNRLKDGPDPSDISAAQARIEAIQSTLSQTALEAPFNGTITDVNVKAGDQVAPGGQAFRIDDLSRLLVDVQITEVDINRIKVGQPAVMTFDAIPDKDYQGKVTEVARVGTSVQGVVNFTVTVELTNPDQDVLPGMTSAVNINTDTAKNVLIVPNRAVRLRDGKRVVYVLRPDNPVPQVVEIELGLTSDTQSEVVSGDVKEGDVLVLNPPTQNTFQGPFGGGRPGSGTGN
jgi:HlyD family secretion protein